MRLDDLATPPPPPGPADWNPEGVVICEQFFGDADLAPYRAEWSHQAPDIRGWPDACPYMEHPALRALCCHPRLAQLLEGLTGEAMAVNLNLTGWISTERDWHADSYLNEPEVGDWYAAVWIALADIDPDAGPFQYVPGSHRWPQITRETIARFYDIDDPTWPKQSEGLLTELFEQEIKERGALVVSYVPKAGDLLVWHGRLLHRGSRPRVRGLQRPALIAHYSGIHHRPRMPAAVQHEAGGWYFPITEKVPV